MSKRYTETVCVDGAGIMDNGKLMTITQVLDKLNSTEETERGKLRKVKFRTRHNDDYEISGFFHKWIEERQGYMSAIVELIDGTIKLIDSANIKFIS